ncbi:MAG TPA: 50S ribosomal protein L24 [Candidatus Binatia bacterium]|jgi:large subunit ribosomal protein L24
MAKQNIKKGDTVIVIAGKDKGKTGKVTRVLTDGDRIQVERIAMVKRHNKPRGQQPGGILEKETPIHISNVMLLCPSVHKPTRVGRKAIEGGKGGKTRHVRVSRVSGEVIDAR